ncbi:MAG: AAA family ATPase [Hyphomicrobium sp.]|nr:AAA family ATPase [Hyphomicrobium sp.]
MSVHNLDPYIRRSESSGSREFLTRADIARFCRRNSKLIALPIALSLGVAYLYILLVPPLFTARSELLIDPKLSQTIRESGDSSSFFDAPQLENQIAVLRSESVAREVVAALALHNNSEFSGQKTASVLSRFFSLSEPTELPEAVRKANAVTAVRSALELRRIGSSYAIEVSFTSKNPQTAADVVNATTAAYLDDLVKARGEAARQGSIWLEQRVEELRNQMNDAARRVQEFRASHDYRIHKRSDGPLGGEAKPSDQATNASATLDELESTAATYRRIYENFYQAFAEAVQRETYPVSNARVISPAKPPTTKSHPKALLTMLLAALFGTIIGVLLALLRNNIDKPVTDARTVRSLLGLKCLGQLPMVVFPGHREWQIRLQNFRSALFGKAENRSKGFARVKPAYSALTRSPSSTLQRNLFWYSVDVPMTAFSQAVRRVRTGISLDAATKPIKTLGVSSGSPGEGKSTLAANLAAQFASKSARVLLVDADVYRATLTSNLAPGATRGLLEVALDSANLDDVLVASPFQGLSILPMVRRPDTMIKAHHLLASEEMFAFLASAKEAFDTVIVDLPPLRLATESYEFAAKLDCVVLVAEADVTPLSHLDETLTLLRQARVHIAGLVINKLTANLFRSSGQRAEVYYRAD